MPNRRDFLLTAASTAVALAAAPRAFAEAPAHAAPRVADPTLRAFLDRLTDELLVANPEEAGFLGVDTGARATLKSRLTDRSWASVEQGRRFDAERLKELRRIDPERLDPLDRVNYETVAYALQLGADSAAFPFGEVTLAAAMNESSGPYVVNQQSGALNVVPEFLINQHAIDDRADAEAYLARLGQFGKVLDEETERVRRDMGQGVIAPDFILDTTLGQMTAFRATAAATSRLVTSLADRAKAKGLAGDWAGQAGRIVESGVYPALDRQIAAIRDARARANADAGVWKLRDGDAYYAWQLRAGTTTSTSAAEIHRIGLEQVEAIGARMDALLRQQGLTRGTVGERMKALGEDPKNLYPNTDEGRAQLIRYLNDHIAKVRARIPEAFNLRLRANVVVKRVPPEIEAGAPLGYENDGSIDGTRPATYYINLKDTANWPRFMLPTLTYHETIPGHVWQGAYLLETGALPLIRSVLSGFNAYVEGWALYAEQLADEIGLYEDDPLGRLGYLKDQRFRACRLVVDTGLHSGALRWSRDKAVDWLVETNGEPRDAMRSEVDRYCAWPGQACGYKMGHNEINRLRDRAKAALGNRFSLRDYDDLICETGGVPLAVLDGVVDRYLAKAKAKAKAG